MKLTFKFRPSKSGDGSGVLYAAISHNGQRSRLFSTHIRLGAGEYPDYAPQTQAQIVQLQEKVQKIAHTGGTDNLERIVEALLEGDRAKTLLYWAQKLNDAKALESSRLAKRTVETYATRFNKLKHYLDGKAVPLSQIDHRWADAYLAWLLGNRHERNYALKQVQYVKHILAFAEMEDAVPKNRLRYFRLGFEQKPIIYLDPSEIALIQNARLDEHLRYFADLFLFQCETGLAYADLVKFADYQIQVMRGRLCLVGHRKKSTVTFFVPVTENAKVLLASLTSKSSGSLAVPTNQHYNKMLKYIQGVTGIKKKLTTHLARKTAGMVWLNEGYSLESVSHMLGHTSIKTTQRWYARVLPTRVLREADEIEARHRAPVAV